MQVDDEVGFGGRRSFVDDVYGKVKWGFDFIAYFLLYIVQSLSLRGIFWIDMILHWFAKIKF